MKGVVVAAGPVLGRAHSTPFCCPFWMRQRHHYKDGVSNSCSRHKKIANAAFIRRGTKLTAPVLAKYDGRP